MAFCSKCGTEVTGGSAFCQACGTPVSGTTDQQQTYSGSDSQPGGYTNQNHAQPIQYDSLEQDVQANKVFGILAYIGILVLVTILAAPKESKYTKFHANQGLVLLIADICGGIVIGILAAILSVVFAAVHLWGISALIIGILWPAFGILVVVIAIMGIVNAANGQMKPLPIIGKIQILK